MTKIGLIHDIYQFLVYPFCGMKLLFFNKEQLNYLFLSGGQMIL